MAPLSWPPIAAWLVALSCTAIATSLLREVRRLAPPSGPRLLGELAEGLSPSLDEAQRRRTIVAELNERLSEVAFRLGLMPARFGALTRVVLSGPTGLALYGYIVSREASLLERGLGIGASALAGVLGLLSVLALGRVAKERARAIREAWDRASREAGSAIGASLQDRGAGRPSSTLRSERRS